MLVASALALAAALATSLAAAPTPDTVVVVPPTREIPVGVLHEWVRAGRLDDAEPALQAALAGPAPGWLRAADGLVELALRSPRPWKVRARWMGDGPGRLSPPTRRDLVLLQLDLALRRPDATTRLAALRPPSWAPEFPRVMELGERYLSREDRTTQLQEWVSSQGGPGLAGAELVAALGAVLEERGALASAGAVYRRALLAWDPSRTIVPWAPLSPPPTPDVRAERLRRTHASRAGRRRLREELRPDENLGWRASVRGWMRLAWALGTIGEDQDAAGALGEAERRLPPDRRYPRLLLAGLALRLDHPHLARRLYRECLEIPAGPGDEADPTGQGPGRLLALTAAADWLAGAHDLAARTLAAAAREGARVEDVATLFLDHTPDRVALEALAELGDLPASQGLGLVAAHSLTALHRRERAATVLEATVREGPRELAEAALELLWSSFDPGRALDALRGSRLAREAPDRALRRLTGAPPLRPETGQEDPRLAAAAWAAAQAQPGVATLEDALMEAWLTWAHRLPPARAEDLARGLSPPARELLTWTHTATPPTASPAPWVASRPRRGLLERALELALREGWERWGGELVAAVREREPSPDLRAAAAHSAAVLAAREGDTLGAIVAALQAIEDRPEAVRTRAFLVDQLAVEAPHRRVLQAWAAHVENDHRFALVLRDLWASTGRPQRALGPLLRARRAVPRDGRLAAATGALLQSLGREPEALPHLLAAARLHQFRHDPDYAVPLAMALAHGGHAARARKLYSYWSRQDPGGAVAREWRVLGPMLGASERASGAPQASETARGD